VFFNSLLEGDPSMNILLVEDNPADARLIGETLKESHAVTFRLTHRERLDAALASIGSSSFDAVLLDLDLPDSRGLDTVARMIAAAPNLPVIVLTGFEDEFTGEKAVEMGAQDYLVKGRVSEFIVTRAIVYACQRKKFAEMSQANALLMQEVREREQAEVLVKKERKRLFDVLEMLPAYVVLLTKDHHIAFANRFFRERFGDDHGRRCFEYLFRRSEPCEVCESYKVLETHAPHRWEWNGPDGRDYDIHDFPFTDADGSQLVMEMGIDITERNQVEKSLKLSEQQLRSLSTQLLVSQETERKRVAQELHDSVGQTLSALKFAVECTLNQSGETRGGNYRKSLQELIPRIQGAVEEVGRIGKGLHPAVLDDLGIMATISWFCREFQSLYSGIRIEKELAIAEDEVPENLRVVIYRILQESLNNIAKHSHADRVHLSLEKTGRVVVLTVRDNGRGFSVDAALLPENQRRGFGLFSMKKRAELSGGNLLITSDQGRGTMVRASWPAP
jgi:two-component system sensor histidine kinase UhpB